MTDPSPRPAARLAVLGSPIAHSRSPLLHAAAYARLGLDWEYGTREVREPELEGVLARLTPEWRGLSLTMPLKAEAHRLADRLDAASELTGAVNTLLLDRSAGGLELRGFNTDIEGIVRAIGGVAPDVAALRGAHAEILGGGATAASALVACARLGFASVRLLVRDPARADAARELGERLGLEAAVSRFSEYAPREDAALVLSTLPGGARPDISFPEPVRARAVLFDAAYSPWPSELAHAWGRAGGPVVSGLWMLAHQALIQVRIFHGGDPDRVLPGEDAVLADMLAAVDLH